MNAAGIKLPYFDEILMRIQTEPDSELVQALGTRHVHWGYYAQPEQVDSSTEGLMTAAEVLTERLIAAAQVRDGQRVLDTGCGFGGTLAYLNERFSNLKLTGLNIDGRQLTRARQLLRPRAGNRLAFVEGDACRLPFADRGFDVVLAVECIFHFPSRLRFFKEAHRLLKPGGILVLSDFVPYGPAFAALGPWVLHHNSAISRFYGQFNHHRPCPLLGYRLLARATGFRLVLDEDITRHTLPTYPALLRLLRDIGHREAELATERVALVSQKGWVRYRILSFRAI